MDRPLLKFGIEGITLLAERYWDNHLVLSAIHIELSNRRTKKARDLRASIEQRLKEFARNSFKWPTTAVMPALHAFSKPHFDYKEGMLRFLGYAVGYSGIPEKKRREILDYTLHEELPQIQDTQYMKQWGTPESMTRLKKLAYSIAHFHNMAYQRHQHGHADMSESCDNWMKDLEYLKLNYYVNRYDFCWPRAIQANQDIDRHPPR